MFDFNKDVIQEGDNVITTFKGNKIVLKNIYFYDGPITLQYLPFGGVQAVFNDVMIINTKNGFIATKEVEYDGFLYSVAEISFLYNFVNTVLPN